MGTEIQKTHREGNFILERKKKMDWMTEKQKEDFETVCLLIDMIDSPKEFYHVMNFLDKYDTDVVNCAREYKHCYNSIQYA